MTCLCSLVLIVHSEHPPQEWGWNMEDGGWRVDDGGWRMEDGGWRKEVDRIIVQCE